MHSREAKELGGTANHAETLQRALKKFVADRKKELARCKPDASTASAFPAALPSRSRYIPRHLNREVWSRARNQPQVDHVIPIAVGDLTEISNLRLICGTIEKVDPGPVQKGSDARKRRSEAVRRTLNVRRNGEQVADEADEPFSTGPCQNHNLAAAREWGLWQPGL